jgi:putative phosphoesterase
MRVALISDIHANLVALRAVLTDIERSGVDQIVCLGDVATLGPEPQGVLAQLRELGCACIVGNHDAFVLDGSLLRSYNEAPIIAAAVDWCRERMSEIDLDFLRSFVAELGIDLGGGTKLFLFHGTPRSYMEDLLATTPADEVDRMLDGRTATVMAGGHTHLQMLRQHKGTLLVNTGSVGLPFKEYVGGRVPTLLPGHAEYAVVEAANGGVSVSLRRVPVEREALRAAVRACDNPLRETLLEMYA